MTTQKLKQNLIAYLQANKPDESINVRDEVSKEKIELPLISVGINSSEKHSIVLHNVLRCSVSIVLRYHSGDEYTESKEWKEVIEQLIREPEVMAQSLHTGIKVFLWEYEGSTTEWDESIKETTFSASCLFMRI
jgi:hypothetical protein